MCVLCDRFGSETGSLIHSAAGGTSGGSISPVAASTGYVSATGNADIDGLLSGSKWTGTVTYSFPDSASDYGGSYGSGEPTATGFSQISAAQQQLFFDAMALIGGYTDLTLTYAGAGDADIQIAQSSEANPTAYAYYPSSYYEEGGDIWFGTSYNFRSPKMGDYYYAAHLHELGHALGLKHGHQTGGVANVAVPTGHDAMEYTIMTYRSYLNGPTTGYTNAQYGYATTFMMNDILALQTMYGADFTTQSGNTVYTWSPTTGQQFINGVGQGIPGGGSGGSAANRIFMTVWDGGGEDTYDFSNYSGGTVIDLSPGGYSTASTAQKAYLGGGNYAKGNVYNAYLFNNDGRSYIENAIGGAGADTITGNAIANKLEGRGGADTISGAAGNDTLTGGAGVDTLTGGTGNDVFVFAAGDGADTITDFKLASGNSDKLDLRAFTSLLTFADVLALASQVGANTVINLGGGDVVTLANFTLSTLVSSAVVLAGGSTPSTGGNRPTDIALSNATVTEGAAVGTLVGTLSATDADAGETFTWKLISNPGSKFTISGDTIVTRGLLNYETQKSYALKVRVTDSSNLTYDKILTVQVGNEAPAAPADAYTRADTVLEGAAKGSIVGIRALAADPRGGAVTYSLTESAGGRFAINAKTGIVTVLNGALIDYETATEHTITVRASDGQLSSEQSFVIGILDRPGEAISGNRFANIIDGSSRSLARAEAPGTEDDRIFGRAGNDRLGGLDGDDFIDGGRGRDLMRGGAGDDTFIVGERGDRVIERYDDGYDTIRSDISFSLPRNVEVLKLVGSRSIDGVGNDRDNLIVGNGADNRLVGEGGIDTLKGGAGDDTLVGGAGSDILAGGEGADTFLFESLADGVDWIADFASGIDRIAVDAAAFGLVPGEPAVLAAAADLASATTPDGHGAFVLVTGGESAGTVYFDPTGGSPEDAVALFSLGGNATLAASDLQLL